MGAVFEGSGNGSQIEQDAVSVNKKANDLYDLVVRIKDEIHAVDEEIIAMAQNGLKGTAVEAYVKTYEDNRKVIDDFVKRFAAVACVLSESAIAHSNINEEAEIAAGGGR